MPASPSTDNYYVGKGKISFKATGENAFRDVGNVSSLETAPNVTTLEHFSSREGVKKKDMEVVTEKKMTVTMVMDEWTADNGRPMVTELEEALEVIAATFIVRWLGAVKMFDIALAATNGGPGRANRPEKAGLVALMTGRARLLHLDEQRVPVAVKRHVLDRLRVPAFLALHPELLPGTAPEMRFAGGDGGFERGAIHPRHHQHAAGGLLLDDGRDEAVGGELEFVVEAHFESGVESGELGVEVASGLPSPVSSRTKKTAASTQAKAT